MPMLTSPKSDSEASNWVRRFVSLIPKNAGPVLDLACGGGRHTRLLLDHGYEVCAVDKEDILLQPLAAIGARTFQLDLEAEHQPGVEIWPFDRHHFAGVIVTNYLHRPLFPHLKTALSNNGVLIYETFAEGNAAFGRPRNPHFLLRSGELLQEFMSDIDVDQQNQVLAYEHGYVETPYPAMVQRICLRSTSRAATDQASYSLNRI
ncbi:class I SAM-dependent methyltransferase [Undibacterium sp. Jales W-56]|uniref:class I SAM-dependent methyltransferase n=1 Tax=Undibacterium sp. Jales W-56 TaxID=2897325 RepID=UPI0021CEDC52|nr:class I SAM-dependent methyltransferase [Undibacterium sp. Jales W-56]MCU6433286.1 class I SAM-dependent methyltransferase [Undibacterium sp. Jales W-56]